MHGLHPHYAPPTVADYGDLLTMTATVHPIFGVKTAQDLSFSSGHAPSGVHGELQVGGVGTSGGSDPGGGVAGASSGGGSGGGGSGGGGGGGGHLPFTGLVVGLVAGVGSGLVVAGDALRRTLRRRPKT
jgi:hypothetical protein